MNKWNDKSVFLSCSLFLKSVNKFKIFKKENSFENHLKLGQKFRSCILRIILKSLHDSDDTREASIQLFREDIPARMISSTRRMLVAITVLKRGGGISDGSDFRYEP